MQTDVTNVQTQIESLYQTFVDSKAPNFEGNGESSILAIYAADTWGPISDPTSTVGTFNLTAYNIVTGR
jgi:hypothetical protein